MQHAINKLDEKNGRAAVSYTHLVSMLALVAGIAVLVIIGGYVVIQSIRCV